ncbi:type I-E CRISPR-associated protein Cas5/CasD [Streptomyces triticirhizae]|uniref:Type I-E CRISPR-associated protein Cas5/CasD n=1 Tax=Streptomyces triticirhizae TaxID=2483353 RepID=A0A3M2LSM1_9ACTN|nr:type I-E CRISPR-associated protein Cas5/CasD [Streptomyces triticirhizae]RMI40471.1 type I-E CRISPR-associated protein Cas5/CasD [Streptomyces triticirhizae]
MTATLLLRLAGPLQGWGDVSRYNHRDTIYRPTKSGVIGLLAAADGHQRDEVRGPGDDCLPLSTLAALRFGVRADRPGVLINDFHTAGGGRFPLRTRELITDGRRAAAYGDPAEGEVALHGWYGAPKGIGPDADGVLVASNTRRHPVVSFREYLSDAAFVAAVESEDEALLRRLADRLDHPRRMLWLGRKHCPPTGQLNGGVHAGSLESVLGRTAPLPNSTSDPVRVWFEVPDDTPAATPVFDQPVSFASRHRSHAQRWERSTEITITDPTISWEREVEEVER